MLPRQHHDRKTVNVMVYQNTKIDKQRHTTDKNQGEDGGCIRLVCNIKKHGRKGAERLYLEIYIQSFK